MPEAKPNGKLPRAEWPPLNWRVMLKPRRAGKARHDRDEGARGDVDRAADGEHDHRPAEVCPSPVTAPGSMATHENVRRRRGGELVMGPRLRGRCPLLPRGRLAPPRSPPPAGPFLSVVPSKSVRRDRDFVEEFPPREIVRRRSGGALVMGSRPLRECPPSSCGHT